MSEQAALHLDTHIALWLYAGERERLRVYEAQLNSHKLFCSSLVKLELQYLYETSRIKVKGKQIADTLFGELGILFTQSSLGQLTEKALQLSWTRDPFDRLICADALVHDAKLLTRDRRIIQNFEAALAAP
ncbi:MAG: PIN domain-containing protein [Myxococcales bacterium]|nr:MAG: PIN domain-containing protein [Myxococcales bacterium]